MKKVLIGLAATVVVIVGAAAAAVPSIEKHTAHSIKEELERDGTSKVDKVEVGLWDRSITMENLRNNSAAQITAARWSASGLSWPLIEIVRGNLPLNGLKLGDPLKAARVEATDLKLSDAVGNSWSFGRLLLQDVDIARYDADVGTAPFSFTVLGARLLQALSIGHFEEHDVSFVPGGSSDVYKFATITIDKAEKGRLGSIVVSKFEGTDRNSSTAGLSVADIRITGLDFRRILGSMSASTWYPGTPTGRLNLETASASGFGGALLTRYGISLEKVSTEIVHESDKVSRARSKVEGLVLTAPRGLEGLQVRLVLTAMGLRDVRLGFDCSGVEDRSKQELTVDHCALTSPDLAEINLIATMVDADEVFWQALDSGDLFLAYSSKAAVGGLKLTLADKSLLDRAIRAMAATSGQPAAAVRSQLAQEVRRFQPPGVLITEDLGKLLDTVARFIEQGGTLTLEARPDPPFALQKIGYLATPGPDLVSVLGITTRLSR